MKSLVLKDLYNICHNAKSMALILGLLAAGYVLLRNPSASLYLCCYLCSMMTVTTFSFDHESQWTPYALIMPVSRRDLVAGKFAVLCIFTGAGTVCGVCLSVLGGLAGSIFFSGSSAAPGAWLALLALALLAFSFCLMAGGLALPLLFKFGTANARMLLVLSSLMLVALFAGFSFLLPRLGLDLDDPAALLALAGASVPLALAWNYGMYRISCRIFEGKDL